jgi:hypothetical protein
VGIFDFFADTYDTERLKILTVWSQIPDDRMRFRPEPRARSPLEHMVHQCMSEDGWMKNMLRIDVGLPVLPADETRVAFIEHYAAVSAARLSVLRTRPTPGSRSRRSSSTPRDRVRGCWCGASRTRHIIVASSPRICACGDSRSSRPTDRPRTPAGCRRTARRWSTGTTR